MMVRKTFALARHLLSGYQTTHSNRKPKVRGIVVKAYLIMYWTVGQKTSDLILSKKDNLVISLICDERYITEHL